MPRDSRPPPVKLYYRIGEVSELVGVEPHVLRYWESEFPTIRPQKSRSGQRVYSRRDVDKLLRVKDLLYAQRFTIAGARQKLRSATSEGPTGGPSSSMPSSDAIPSSDSASEPMLSIQTKSMGARGAVATSVQPKSANHEVTRAAATALRATLLDIRRQIVDLVAMMPNGTRAQDRGDEHGDANGMLDRDRASMSPPNHHDEQAHTQVMISQDQRKPGRKSGDSDG